MDRWSSRNHVNHVLKLSQTLVAAAGLMLGCSGPTRDPSESRDSPRRVGVADAVNAFGTDLFRLQYEDGVNALISPLSVASALAMTYAGATGETAREMASTLHLPQGGMAVHEDYQSLLTEVAATDEQDGYQVNVANRLFGQESLAFKAPFLETTREYYGAELMPVDFRSDADGARQTINRWVEEQTKERIKDLLPDGAVNGSTVLTLVNAVYFNAEWQTKFAVEETYPASFAKADGTTVESPFMHATGMYRYLADAEVGVEVIELPYAAAEGSESAAGTSMVIFLPSEGTDVAEFGRTFSATRLETLIHSLYAREPQHVALRLPKWTFASPSLPLKETLTALGMGRAFDAGRAELDGIAAVEPERLFIDDVRHKTFIGVTESGTEAAGATGVVVGVTSVPSTQFVADRPFVYAIRDNGTGALLFLGTLADPAT